MKMPGYMRDVLETLSDKSAIEWVTWLSNKHPNAGDKMARVILKAHPAVAKKVGPVPICKRKA